MKSNSSLAVFSVIVVLWALMIYYTVVPWFFDVRLEVNQSIDITPFTWALVALAMTSSVLWLTMQTAYLFSRNRLKRRSISLIQAHRYDLHEPLVSIIIPARNEESVIKRTIVSCLAQTYRNIEAIVVCHNCSDNTFAAAQSADARVKVFDYKTSEAGKGIALNFGLEKANGEYVLVVDSDGILASDFVTNALPIFSDENVAIQGKIVGSNAQYNTITQLLSLEAYLFSIPFMTVRSLLDRRVPLGGTGCMIRKDKLVQLGGFRNALVDDFELSFRIYRNNYRIAFAPLSVIYDEKPPEFELMVKQRSRWVKGHIDLLKERIPEGRDVLGAIYWLNPIFMFAGLAAISISSFAVIYYILFGIIPFRFTFAPFWLWIGMSSAGFVLQLAVLVADFGIRGFRYFFHVALLSAFSHYWYVSLIKSLSVKSWAQTKTTHGFISENDIELIANDQNEAKYRHGSHSA